MESEIEGAPMDGKQRSASQHREHLERVLWAQVNVAPAFVKGSNFKHDEIERPVFGANGSKLAPTPSDVMMGMSSFERLTIVSRHR
jgi:hypothetical protein